MAISINDMIAEFPEWAYPPLSHLIENYEEKLLIGQQRAMLSRAAILGMVRNQEKILPFTLLRIEKIASLFKESHVLILENDSIDDTKGILEEWNPKGIDYHLDSMNLGMPKLGQDKDLRRAKGMCLLRNYLRDQFIKDKYNVDYVIVIDMDLSGGFSLEGILNSLGHNDWNCIGSNSITYDVYKGKLRRLYYDIWGLRFVGDVTQQPSDRLNMLKFYRGDRLIPVWSAAGGLILYTNESFCYEHARYKPINDRGKIECDHVSFATSLRTYGFRKFYLNPSQITLYDEPIQ